MRLIRLMLAAVTVLIAVAGHVQAALISPTQYSLTSITGSYAWGETDWNDVSTFGYVNNVSNLARVNTLLAGPYVFSPRNETGSHSATINGIYNWSSSGFHALTFQFNGGQDHILNSLSFVSSRSYSPSTPITVDYSQNNGASWTTAVATTSGALGIVTGTAATYTLSLGGVEADAFRFTTNGGDQVSLHQILIDGSALIAPSITSAASDTFAGGLFNSFTVTATGLPNPTLSESGALPAGVTFNPLTGLLSGTPAAVGGNYFVTFYADNGVNPEAIQSFELTVTPEPSSLALLCTGIGMGAVVVVRRRRMAIIN